MDINRVIRDYLLRNDVVNVLSFKTCKVSKCSIETSEVPMFLDNKLPRSDTRHVNRKTDELVSRTLILTVVSTGQKSSELLFTLTLGSYYRRTETLFQKRNMQHQ